MHTFLRTCSIFWQFMRRDLFVHREDFFMHAVNALIISPLLFGISFAYIQKTVYFGTDATAHLQGTIMFLGSMMIPILVITWKLLAELLFDLEGNRFIQYQLTILSPQLVLLQRILFASCYTICLTIPFLPLTALIVGNNLDLEHTNWFAYTGIICTGALCCASYNMFVVNMLKVERLKSFWIRVNWPLMNLGGFWVPRALIAQFWAPLGYLALCNPITYILEGLRSAVTGSATFIPASTCCGMLMLFSILCFGLACIAFKKRIDHI